MCPLITIKKNKSKTLKMYTKLVDQNNFSFEDINQFEIKLSLTKSIDDNYFNKIALHIVLMCNQATFDCYW